MRTMVAPSMSGAFAFPLLAKKPELVAAFVAIAPAAVDRLADVKSIQVPALIVWGTADRVFPVGGAAALAA